MMRRCVFVLLCVSALVLCASGLPLKADADPALDHQVKKLDSAELRPSEAKTMGKEAEVDVDADSKEEEEEVDVVADSKAEEAESVERAFYPSYSTPYYPAPYAAPYGGGYGAPYQAPYQAPSQGGFQSPYQAPYVPPSNPKSVMDTAFHSVKPTTAVQQMSSQGNAQAFGTIAADSYEQPSRGGRRRRAAELEAAADQVAEKLAKIVELNKVDAEVPDEVDDSVNENVERNGGYDFGSPYGNAYPSYPAPYGNNYQPYAAPYGNSYQPYATPYGNSYQPTAAPYGNDAYKPAAVPGPDSAKLSQAAASTKSIYMEGGTSSTRPVAAAPNNPYSPQPH